MSEISKTVEMDRYSKPCIYGDKCRNVNCIFFHVRGAFRRGLQPQGKDKHPEYLFLEHIMSQFYLKRDNKNIVKTPCPYLYLCENKEKCGYYHIPDNFLDDKQVCKYNDLCNNKKCVFYHSLGILRPGLNKQDGKTPKPRCKYGRNCVDIRICRFYHYPIDTYISQLVSQLQLSFFNWKKVLIVPCKSNSRCRNNDCIYYHTHGKKRYGLNNHNKGKNVKKIQTLEEDVQESQEDDVQESQKDVKESK